MLYKEYFKKGYKYIEIRQGVKGNGDEQFAVQTCRIGSKGQDITWHEEFDTAGEAENWVKWTVLS